MLCFDNNGYSFIGAKQSIATLPFVLCKLKSTFDTFNSKSLLHFDYQVEMINYEFCIKMLKIGFNTNVKKSDERFFHCL